MTQRYDTIVVGAGLAGTCAALHLSRRERVLLLEARQPAAGASGAAAGLVNPLMGRKARPVWRLDETLGALDALLYEAGAQALFRRSGVLRPARDARQADFFQEAARVYPGEAMWLQPEAAAERYSDVHAPHGALLVRRGGSVDVGTFVQALAQAAQRQGACLRAETPVRAWGETASGAFVLAGAEGEPARFEAERVLLAMGYDLARRAEELRLPLHGVKGQTAWVRPPSSLAGPLPALSGYGYVVPEGAAWAVGSSYEHTFDHLAPSSEVSRRLVAKAARMVPALTGAEVAEARAGVRVTVPHAGRLPLVGPLPGHERVWVFSGLGSKGLLMAPLLAASLPAFFADPAQIPHEVRLER